MSWAEASYTIDELSKKIDESGGGGAHSVIDLVTDTYQGETIHVVKTDGFVSYAGTFDNEGKASIIVDYIGDYDVYVEETAKIRVTIYEAQQVVHATLNEHRVYGFHIYGAIADPTANVDYHVQYDGYNVVNYDYDPVQMDLTTGEMDPGSWNLVDDFFIPKSCMLLLNGTVDYYLDENDETKKADGVTPSDVANTSYNGNAMMEWGRDGRKIYMKIVPDATPTNGATVFIADYRADEDFTSWPFYDADGNEIDHFYTPKYPGGLVGNRLAILSGLAPCNTHSGSDEVTYATANNVNGATEWYTEVLADRQLINMLLVMIGRSTDTQSVFGQGYTTGGSAASSLANSGTLNGKGQWYGSSVNNDKTKGVKVFGMEHWSGNIWRRTAGYLNMNGTVKYKMTYSTVDGTTQTGYDATGSGYKTVANGTPGGTSGGYTNVAVFNEDGFFPKTASGSETTYYCDGLRFNNSQANYALVGGDCSNGSLCGALCVGLSYAFSAAGWNLGAALSCKPLAA